MTTDRDPLDIPDFLVVTKEEQERRNKWNRENPVKPLPREPRSRKRLHSLALPRNMSPVAWDLHRERERAKKDQQKQRLAALRERMDRRVR